MKEIYKNILMLIIVLIITLIVLEFLTRAIYGQNLKYEYTNDTLWELKPTQKGFTYPNNKIATINSYGLRGEEIVSSKESIILLGDSFIFGYAIGDNDTISHNLEEEIKTKQIINGGVPGYGIEQMIELYRKKLRDLNHETIVLTLIKTDIYRQKSAKDYNKKMFARKAIRKSTLISFLKPRLEIIRELFVTEKEESFNQFLEKDKKRIIEFKTELMKNGKKLIIFPYITKKEENEFYKELENFAKENNITITPNNYKLLEEYNGNPSDLKAEDSHPSEIQTKIISKFLKEIINKYQ
ncbi:hypothetical protein J4459_01870 [Candidatus Woesearchaeota archaeon]|nr:hypothetical protein [Candidatus Woesearchaeota archaeon]